MTDPSQYFKGRTVQEQMNEVIGYVDVRSAEVATTAIASDVAQVHQDMLDADADAAAAAASAAAAAGTLANAVKKTGEASQSITGDIAVAGNLTGGTITAPAPVNNTDAANKKYVDDTDALKMNIADVNSYAVGLTGNQKVAGRKDMLNPIHGGCVTDLGVLPGTAGEFICIARMQSYSQTEFIIHATTPNNGLGRAHIVVGGSDQYDRSYVLDRRGVLVSTAFYRIATSGVNELWIQKSANTNTMVVACVFKTGTVDENVFAATGLTTAPNIGDTNPITSAAITGSTLLQ